MIRKLALWLPLLMCGCFHRPPVQPDSLTIRVEKWNAKHAARLFADCLPVGAKLVPPRSAWRYGANVAMVHSNLLDVLLFRCETMPSWPRQDLPAVRQQLAVARERGGLTCASPPPELTESPLPLNQPAAPPTAPTDVTIESKGKGRLATANDFLDVRVQHLQLELGQEMTVYHHRTASSTNPKARRLPAGTLMPLHSPPIERVRHGSCWSPCELEVLEQLRPGGKARFTCGGLTSSFELLAVGDEHLFLHHIGL